MRFRLVAVALWIAVAAPAAAEWHVATSAHFIVYSNDSEARVRDLATRLERFDRAVRVLRSLPDEPVSPSSRVTVYALDNMAAVGRLAGSQNIAGFYMPRASGSVAFVPRRAGTGTQDMGALATLLHEYSHHILMTAFAHYAIPSWVNEGYAEFHSTAEIRDDGSVMFGHAPQFRAAGLLMQRPMPAARLLANERAKGAGAIDAFYGRSWLLTHMLTFSTERRGQLGRYLAAINDGVEIEEAARQAFGEPAALDRELGGYLRQRRISGITLAAERLPIGEVSVERLSPGAAAVMAARIQSTRGVDQESGPRVLEMAKRAAAPHPNDPYAQRVLAECEYDVGNFQEAAAAADRAIAADPTMVDALVYRGMAAMALAAEKGAGATPADWTAARRWFLRANVAENDAPMPLMLFYGSYAAAGEEPTTNARDALARAQELAPHDLGLRLQTATMWLERGEGERAAPLLKPVAYSPHGGGLARAAAAALVALDGAGAAAALEALRTPPQEEDDEAD